MIDEEELKKYASSWSKPQVEIVEEKEESEKPEPRGVQIEALHELKLARKEGVKKGLVVAATGVGKTYLAAFDSIKFDKVLFKYHGIHDIEVDYEEVDYSSGSYNKKDLEKELSTHKRADLILRNYRNLAGQRTLGFCASINHARYMAEYFNENNIRAVCVHSSSDQREYFMERKKAVEKLEAGEINVIFAVDIFNEGVDIPALDTVLFLRLTESYVVFLQQLGRGLRKYEDKEYLKVLDFIGNYNVGFQIV